MRTSTLRAAARAVGVATITACVALVPATAAAQFGQQDKGRPTPPAESYHVEVSGNLWNPSLFGVISSEQFGQVGSDIDFTTDLGYERTRFKDLRIVLRPATKHRFRAQYTPVVYTAEKNFSRNIVFNGILFPVSVPVESTFEWKTWRLGYEYDFVYQPWGFVGVLLEARMTNFNAELNSVLASEYATAKGPLPAIGVVARGYVHPTVALNFEMSGMRVPEIDPKYHANYLDWDLYGTVNFGRNGGFQMGYRKARTFLSIENDLGDLKFGGIWFGAVLRY
jgi:hypothetical protein